MVNSESFLRPNQGGIYIDNEREPKSEPIEVGTKLATRIGHRIGDKRIKYGYTVVYGGCKD